MQAWASVQSLDSWYVEGWGGAGIAPEKVHAQKGFPLPNWLLGPDGLVADTDTMLVGTHLSPPQPRRAA